MRSYHSVSRHSKTGHLRVRVGTIVWLTLAMFVAVGSASAAQKAFLLSESQSSETIPGNYPTNITVTLTYSNLSGTINNATFANTVTVTPAGQGITASLNPISPAVADNGGSATLPLTLSAVANDAANTTFQIVVTASNSAFTANVPPGVASITNSLFVAGPANSNAFSLSLSPSARAVAAIAATNIISIVTLVDLSSTISGIITNGVSVSGPDTADVTAMLDNPYAAVTNGFGQTNLTLTIHANSNAVAGNYTITVAGTNSAFTANSTPGIATATFDLTIFTPAVFTMGIVPASETVAGGIATNVTVAVTFTNVSGNLTEPLTNGVTVIGPDTANVTASLNSLLAMPAAGGGTESLSLTIANNGFAQPGNYQVIVAATNANYTGNTPIPGVALATNLFVITPVTSPVVNGLNVSGQTVEISGSNGLAGKPCVVFSSSILALPQAQWLPVATNVFDSGGDFDFHLNLSQLPSADAPQQFFTVAIDFQAIISLPKVVTPVFTPLAAPYFAETSVTITSATAGASIRYTTDGSTPSETHGTMYSGPVLMPQAVDTNLTGFLTNASGVTMLKAIAYENGMSDSAVFAGSYEILVPMKYPPLPSPVVGIAHIAYHVTGANWNDTLSFWTNYFGFSPVVVSNNFALIKINDQQYVELYEGPLDPAQFQLVNWGFQVTNAEVYREQLASAGVTVPPGVSTNALGNLSFFTTDPDGHTNEWVQYLTNSITGQSLGQDMPSTEVFGYINGIGNCTTNETAADNYYINQCGFVTNQTHDVYIPNVNGYIEMLTANPGQVTAALAGKHEKIQLLNFQGINLSQSLSVVTNRNPSIPVTLSVEGTPNTKEQNAADVYDDDGSRVRMVDE